MATLLLEDLGNLNRIDKSLLLYNDRNGEGHPMNLGATGITEKSRIEVNRITPHNFTTLMGMLDDDDSIGAIVVRAHGRQLCLVTKLHLYSRQSYVYFLKFSDYAMQRVKMTDYYTYSGFLKNDRPAPIKTAISRCVKGFYDNIAPEGTRKNWDTVIIYKDETVDNTRNKRAESQKGMIKNPGENGYEEFEAELKNQFKERCRDYLDKVRPDTTNKQQIIDYLMNRANIDKFKFNGYTYNLEDGDYGKVGNRFREIYVRQVFDNGADYDKAPRKIRLTFNWKGYVPYIDYIEYSNDVYRYSSNTWYPLEKLAQDSDFQR